MESILQISRFRFSSFRIRRSSSGVQLGQLSFRNSSSRQPQLAQYSFRKIFATRSLRTSSLSSQRRTLTKSSSRRTASSFKSFSFQSNISSNKRHSLRTRLQTSSFSKELPNSNFSNQLQTGSFRRIFYRFRSSFRTAISNQYLCSSLALSTAMAERRSLTRAFRVLFLAAWSSRSTSQLPEG